MKNNQHIIITGGAGFIGSHIACRLIGEGHRVTVLDNLSTGEKKNIPPKADFIKMDLGQEASYASLKNITCNAVFHLAGQSSGEASFKDPTYDFRSHAVSTFCLLEWCRRKGVPRFLYASSMGVYGEPNYLPVDENHPLQPKSFYAAAKISAEAYVRLYQGLGINATILRMFSVYGPGQNLVNKMKGMVSIYLSYLLERAPLIVKGSKDRIRDLIYIDDVVGAWLAAYQNPAASGKIYNIGSGKKIKVEDLLNTLKELFGDPDYPIEYKDATPGDQFGVVANIERITQDLKWAPGINLREGLKKMIDSQKRGSGIHYGQT